MVVSWRYGENRLTAIWEQGPRPHSALPSRVREAARWVRRTLLVAVLALLPAVSGAPLPADADAPMPAGHKPGGHRSLRRLRSGPRRATTGAMPIAWPGGPTTHWAPRSCNGGTTAGWAARPRSTRSRGSWTSIRTGRTRGCSRRMRKRRWRAASPMPRSSPGITGGIPSAPRAGSAMPMPCWPGARTSARPRWFARPGSRVRSARGNCARPNAATARCCGGRITLRASTAWCGRITAARRGACTAMSMRGISCWRRHGSRSARARAGWTGPSSGCRKSFAIIRG